MLGGSVGVISCVAVSLVDLYWDKHDVLVTCLSEWACATVVLCLSVCVSCLWLWRFDNTAMIGVVTGPRQCCCERVFRCSCVTLKLWMWSYHVYYWGFPVTLRCYKCCCGLVFLTAFSSTWYLVVFFWLIVWLCGRVVFEIVKRVKLLRWKGVLGHCVSLTGCLDVLEWGCVYTLVYDRILFKTRWSDSTVLTWWRWLWLCGWKWDCVPLCHHLYILWSVPIWEFSGIQR